MAHRVARVYQSYNILTLIFALIYLFDFYQSHCGVVSMRIYYIILIRAVVLLSVFSLLQGLAYVMLANVVKLYLQSPGRTRVT